jgi:hypothetical protein
MSKKILIILGLAGALGASAAHGEEDLLGRALFLPDLIMNHQQEIQLTDGQREKIVQEFQGLMQKKAELEQKMASAKEKFILISGDTKASEESVMEAFNQLVSAEHAVQNLIVRTLLRVRLQLNEEQIKKLKQIRGV